MGYGLADGEPVRTPLLESLDQPDRNREGIKGLTPPQTTGQILLAQVRTLP